ncbi:Fic family protein [Candidatus Micrarchaeota archaeon]|nr:Fic family protein [Candidatus Micrarchaeota archaeon]
MVLLSKIEGYGRYRGILRPVNVMIRGSSHIFPDYREVFSLMRELIGWYRINKELMHPVELAAKFHTKFTSIHPFADGNGRMARLLMNYILQRNMLPFTNIPLNRRSTYMKTQEAGNSENHKPFTLFLVEEVTKQCKKLKKKD